MREALLLTPGDAAEFDVNREGQVVVRKAGAQPASTHGRFESARGKAQVQWHTDELMALLRWREQIPPCSGIASCSDERPCDNSGTAPILLREAGCKETDR